MKSRILKILFCHQFCQNTAKVGWDLHSGGSLARALDQVFCDRIEDNLRENAYFAAVLFAGKLTTKKLSCCIEQIIK